MAETLEKTLVVGKELSEVVDFVAALLEDIKAGKSAEAIAAENLPGLIQAVGGFSSMPGEFVHESINGTAGYLVDKVLGVFV